MFLTVMFFLGKVMVNAYEGKLSEIQIRYYHKKGIIVICVLDKFYSLSTQ